MLGNEQRCLCFLSMPTIHPPASHDSRVSHHSGQVRLDALIVGMDSDVPASVTECERAAQAGAHVYRTHAAGLDKGRLGSCVTLTCEAGWVRSP